MLPLAFIEDAQREPRRSRVSFARKRVVAEWKEWAASFATSELRQRAEQAIASLGQCEAHQASAGAVAYAPDPARGITKSLTEGALAQWAWTAGSLPALQ